ncbi:MAG TPA: hypothetical protein VGP04_16530 [Pseudonocardiaceae bacterium]|nr:hypothetical protein [Pseudonocardiaceae bacterium]
MTLLWEGHELEEGKMVDDTALDAAELQALRQEITSHFTLSATLIALELAAFGSSLSFVDKSTHVLAGLAVISSFLWLLWIDHSTQILKMPHISPSSSRLACASTWVDRFSVGRSF